MYFEQRHTHTKPLIYTNTPKRRTNIVFLYTKNKMIEQIQWCTGRLSSKNQLFKCLKQPTFFIYSISTGCKEIIDKNFEKLNLFSWKFNFYRQSVPNANRCVYFAKQKIRYKNRYYHHKNDDSPFICVCCWITWSFLSSVFFFLIFWENLYQSREYRNQATFTNIQKVSKHFAIFDKFWKSSVLKCFRQILYKYIFVCSP